MSTEGLRFLEKIINPRYEQSRTSADQQRIARKTAQAGKHWQHHAENQNPNKKQKEAAQQLGQSKQPNSTEGQPISISGYDFCEPNAQELDCGSRLG